MVGMPKESHALFMGLQRKKGASDLKSLITAATAKTPDVYYGMKPLLWAARYGASAEVIKLLLAADPTAISDKHPVEGWTAHHCVESLDAEAFKALLEKDVTNLTVKDSNGMTPLHWAAEYCIGVDMVKLLLQGNKKAAMEKDNYGRLPFKLATVSEASEELLKLIEQANPSAVMRTVETEVLPIALIFPGQGSQYVGMMQEVKDLPAVQSMLAEANEILGYDILDLMLNGPEEKLQDTLHCQPAMFISGLAAVEKLREEKPHAVNCVQGVAGLSLGEYTALCVAGVLSFGDGLRLVRARAEAMQEAANVKPQAMCSIAGLQEKKVLKICDDARKKIGGDAVCQISNYLFDKGYTVGGTKDAVEECEKLCKAAKAMQARLIKASGGFHTALMEPAKNKLRAALEEVKPKMLRPRCKVFMNVNAQPVDRTTDPEKIIDLLADQMTSAVRWKDCMLSMIADGVNEYYECGPMKQLKAMMKRIDADSFSRTTTVDV
mmetsp:Transcript_79683/g.139007  ORF Transcript_79683/g.139007 Transcript_79683/m.139007 type:complete len:493 (+) Transcript_79683:83-1561(+)